MAAYNAESFLRDAVDSVLNQTFSDFEFLIFEDCSIDRTLEILQSYNDPRIKLYANETNQGLTKNLVRGIELATGDYVARMDADDVCMPNRFEQQLEYFAHHPEVSVLGSAVTFFDDKDYEFVGYQPTAHEDIKVTLFLGFTMLHPTVMMRKADMNQHCLNYDPQFVVSQDHDLWTRAIRKLCFANHQLSLLKSRRHGEAIGKTRKSEQEALASMVRQRQLDEIDVSYTAAELNAFNIFAGMASRFKSEQLPDLESILLKIIEANRDVNIYDQTVLEQSVAARYRGVCRMLLLNGNRKGLCYWKSSLRKYDQVSFRQLLGMFVRSALCLIK